MHTNKSRPFTVPNDVMSKNDGVSTEKNASDRAGAFMYCKVGFSLHSPHKQLDIAHIYLGLTFKHCCLNWFISIDFILGKS